MPIDEQLEAPKGEERSGPGQSRPRAEEEVEAETVRKTDGREQNVEEAASPETVTEVKWATDYDLTTGNLDAETVYRLSRVYMTYVRDQIAVGLRIQIDPAVRVRDRVIREHLDRDHVLHNITKLSRKVEYPVAHAVSTAAYAIRVGRQLDYDNEMLKELALAAYLCDIGLFKVPDQIVNKKGKLTPEEIKVVQAHVEIAYDVLKPFAPEYPEMLRAIYEHHERENGQGYPRGLKGDAISERAKIVGICDSFVAMTHSRPHQRALIQTDSIRELVEMKGKLFSAKIIKAFLDAVSIFPIGTYVVLNNKMVGEVIATNRYTPLKPVIRILYDDQGMAFEEPRVVDLMTNPVLHIEGTIALDDLPEGR